MSVFTEGIASWRKVLAATGLGERPAVFANAAHEIATWTQRGLMKADAVDVLVEIGQGIGLDDDQLQDVLDDAFGGLEVVPPVDEDIWTKPNGKPPPEPGFAYRATVFADIARRIWLHAKHYIRGYCVMTIAPGGYGKSSLVLCNALEMVTGRGLIGPAPSERCRVWYWNAEEAERAEIERRIAALCLAHSIPARELEGELFLGNRIGGDDLRFAGIDRNGRLIPNEPLIKAVTQFIGDHRIGCSILDPMIAFHRLPEVDNRAMEGFIKGIIEPIAIATNSCIEFSHHTRKTSAAAYGTAEVTADDSRGAGAALAASRSVRVINRMSVKEAEGASVADEMRRRYLRINRDKENMTPPSKARWVFLADVDIGNAGPKGEPSDHVQAVVSWVYPSAFDGVPVETLHFVRALAAKEEYRKAPNAKDGTWIGVPIAEHLGLDLEKPAERKRVNAILATWFKNGVLAVSERPDKKSNMRPCVIPGPWRDLDLEREEPTML